MRVPARVVLLLLVGPGSTSSIQVRNLLNPLNLGLPAGTIDLIEDTTGKGHITHNIEDRIVVTIPLAEP